jgi:threonine/homoserine/homoserine lactone efflux protein
MSIVVVVIVAFFFGLLGSVPLAGPIALLVVSRAADEEYAAAARVGLGAAIAEGIYAGIAFWGYATFLGRHPLIAPISHAVTAALLVVLGWRFLFFAHSEPRRREVRVDPSRAFLLGFVVSALNPTLLVTWTVAVTFVYAQHDGRIASLLAVPFGVSAALGVVAWFAVLVHLLRVHKQRLTKSLLERVVRLMGLLLIGLGLWSAWGFYGWLRHGLPHGLAMP